MSLAARTLSRWRMDRLTEFAPNLIRFLLFAAIGIEIMVLSTWLPDTLQVWWAPAEGDVADFRYFYDHAQSSSTVGFYNPGLTFLMQPLTTPASGWRPLRPPRAQATVPARPNPVSPLDP